MLLFVFPRRLTDLETSSIIVFKSQLQAYISKNLMPFARTKQVTWALEDGMGILSLFSDI